ncbi:hypothetical protein TK5_25830 [Sideroxyarcus sp. TK5]
MQRCDRYRDMVAHLDHPTGESRLSYARLAGHAVVTLVQFIPCDLVEGEPFSM